MWSHTNGPTILAQSKRKATRTRLEHDVNQLQVKPTRSKTNLEQQENQKQNNSRSNWNRSKRKETLKAGASQPKVIETNPKFIQSRTHPEQR
jgi:hypothetical protein